MSMNERSAIFRYRTGALPCLTLEKESTTDDIRQTLSLFFVRVEFRYQLFSLNDGLYYFHFRRTLFEERSGNDASVI